MLPDDLTDGYRRYREARLPQERRRLAQLARLGQAPRAMVVACCDSRAAPETVFATGPGELFVLRNVANLVPPYAPDGELHGTSAAVEFAVMGLMVPDIVVLGHSRCGGVKAYLTGDRDAAVRGEFIGRWMDLLDGTGQEVAKSGEGADEAALQQAVEEAAVRRSLDNLRTFPAVAERVADGRLALHGAHFDIASGALRVLDAAGRFEAL